MVKPTLTPPFSSAPLGKAMKRHYSTTTPLRNNPPRSATAFKKLNLHTPNARRLTRNACLNYCIVIITSSLLKLCTVLPSTKNKSTTCRANRNPRKKEEVYTGYSLGYVKKRTPAMTSTGKQTCTPFPCKGCHGCWFSIFAPFRLIEIEKKANFDIETPTKERFRE